MNQHQQLLSRLRNADSQDPIPQAIELEEHLLARLSQAPKAIAHGEFRHLHAVAAGIWGAEATTHFAVVQRAVYVTEKSKPQNRWDRCLREVARLPQDWAEIMNRKVEISRSPSGPPTEKWSADYIGAVSRALLIWLDFCSQTDFSINPTGEGFFRFGKQLMDPERKGGPVTVRTASDYLTRAAAGLRLRFGRSLSDACMFVLRDFEEAARRQGSTMKQGCQLVGAQEIFDLGFRLMSDARTRECRGTRAATTFRNGLLLSLGIALPQRARALSALAFGTTLNVHEECRLEVRIPGTMLKFREGDKKNEEFHVLFSAPRLSTALVEYRDEFRPIFDEGSQLFPSIIRRGGAISEQQIGQLAGDLTERHLGVRISIHRFRDNAATDASEILSGGRYASGALLDHSLGSTATAHYDHSQGKAAASEFSGLLDERRKSPTYLNWR